MEFIINRVLMTIFRTVSVDAIRECRLWFGIPDTKELVVKREKKFLMKYANSANITLLSLLELVISLTITLFNACYILTYTSILLCILIH